MINCTARFSCWDLNTQWCMGERGMYPFNSAISILFMQLGNLFCLYFLNVIPYVIGVINNADNTINLTPSF